MKTMRLVKIDSCTLPSESEINILEYMGIIPARKNEGNSAVISVGFMHTSRHEVRWGGWQSSCTHSDVATGDILLLTFENFGNFSFARNAKLRQ